MRGKFPIVVELLEFRQLVWTIACVMDNSIFDPYQLVSKVITLITYKKTSSDPFIMVIQHATTGLNELE